MTIEITRATYSHDGRSPGRSLGDRELALLQEGCDFSITRNIAVIAEQCLGIRDYTNFEYEASKNRFFFRDVAHNAAYTLTKDAGGNWTCDNSSSGVRINNVLISENVVELIIKVKAAYNKASSNGRHRSLSVDTGIGSTHGRGSLSGRHSGVPDSNGNDTGSATPQSTSSNLNRQRNRRRRSSLPSMPPPSPPPSHDQEIQDSVNNLSHKTSQAEDFLAEQRRLREERERARNEN